ATAVACASAPFAALAGAKELPRDTGLQEAAIAGGSNSQRRVPPAHKIFNQRYAQTGALGHDSFQAAIGSAFQVNSTGGNRPPFWLRLLSVKDLDAPMATNPANMAVAPPAALLQAAHTTGFVLGFSGGPLPNVEQETFSFQHPELGQFALFIVPAGPQQYTAIINRLQLKAVIPV
ncbi:MAG: DUF6916 family protein, partial [Candidatus Angelobacter sp.]